MGGVHNPALHEYSSHKIEVKQKCYYTEVFNCFVPYRRLTKGQNTSAEVIKSCFTY